MSSSTIFLNWFFVTLFAVGLRIALDVLAGARVFDPKADGASSFSSFAAFFEAGLFAAFEVVFMGDGDYSFLGEAGTVLRTLRGLLTGAEMLESYGGLRSYFCC